MNQTTTKGLARPGDFSVWMPAGDGSVEELEYPSVRADVPTRWAEAGWTPPAVNAFCRVVVRERREPDP
jgi:hypothetical protein